MLDFKMIKTCILVFIFSTVAIETSEIQIPENFKLAKPISEHPRYQGHQLLDNFSLNAKTSSLIIGGQPAVRGQFPHHALIFIIHPNGDSKSKEKPNKNKLIHLKFQHIYAEVQLLT